MTILLDGGPRMRRDEFRLLRDLVNKRSGMYFDDTSFFVFERRLRERAKALEIGDFSSYYQYLRFHPRGAEELEEAIDALVTNETYFFREEYQLRAFSEDILPRLHEQAAGAHRRRLVIWSAGCSTGEEVYTLAILVLESKLFEGWDVRVFGNDISRRVLGIARRGVYPRHSFRAQPAQYAASVEPDPRGAESSTPCVASASSATST